MDIDIELVRALVGGVVWVVGIITFGRLGMFVATKHYQQRGKDATADRQTDRSADALSRMSRPG